MNTFKKVNRNNKGVSLIELLIAIALLAILIVPVFNSFITSARINRDARKLMNATDVAQTLMEGFSDKSFADIKTAVSILDSSDISGNNAFSTINNGIYNARDNHVSYTQTDWNDLNTVSSNTLIFQTMTYSNRTLVSNNAVSINTAFGNCARTAISMNETQRLVTWSDNAGVALLMAYTNIVHEGYHFDAIISFIPMAENTSDKYYPYNIRIYIYDADITADPSTRMTEPIMMMDGGIANVGRR